MPSHSVLSFRTYYSLLRLRDTYVMVSSCKRCSIYTVGFRNFCSSVLFRNVPFFVLVLLLLCVSSVDIRASGIVFFLFFFSYVFCFINSIIFFISRVFSFIILSRNFLSVIAVMYFDISNSSAEIIVEVTFFFNFN